MQPGELKGRVMLRDSDDPQLLGYRNLVCAAVQLALDDLSMKRMSNLSKEKRLRRWASAAVWLADPWGALAWCELLGMDFYDNIRLCCMNYGSRHSAPTPLVDFS